MRIDNQSRNRTHFTSVIPTRVIVNNHIAIHPETVKTAVRELQRILTHNAKGDDSIIAIKTIFNNTVKDFHYQPEIIYKSGELIRNITDVDITKFSARVPDSGLAYLFTGKQVETLLEKGKKIGPERALSDRYFKKLDSSTSNPKNNSGFKTGRRRSFEELDADINYYSKIKNFLTNPNLFVKGIVQNNNEPLELFINAIKDANGKIKINNIFFKSANKMEKKSSSQISNEVPKATEATKQTTEKPAFIKKRKQAKNTNDTATLNLFS